MGHSFISSPTDILRHLGYIRKGHRNRIVKTHWIPEPVKKPEETNKQKKKERSCKSGKKTVQILCFSKSEKTPGRFFFFFFLHSSQLVGQSTIALFPEFSTPSGMLI